ncbi:microtubule-associated tyrosine carboxypeptidase 1-like [Babylonia areolata]|uniref:microtubule-associated tyrosine carboxypeptidase 1-like n=1 Tax=Babylonia areolata TaxID=304850 RepID=UPI003FD3A656
MAGMCLHSQGVTTVYSSSGRPDMVRGPQTHPPSVWRHDPMLPLQCLMDSKTPPTSVTSLTSASTPQEPNPKRRGKKKLLKKRKSMVSVSCSTLNSSPTLGAGGKGRNLEKGMSSLPDVNINSSRIDELSMPSLRASGAIPSLVAPPYERRKKLPLLAAIKPENEKAERDRFMRANFNYNPHFVYRCPADEETIERFNSPSDRYLNIAVLIMQEAIRHFGSYEDFEEQTGGRVLSKAQIIALVRKYLKKEDLESEIQVNLSEDLLSRGSMTQKNGRAQLNVRVVNLRENWCDGLLRHELGTHYLRSVNNRSQVWGGGRQRRELCLQHFNPTEEGLASLHSVLFRPHPYLWRASLLYYVTHRAANLSFKDLFLDLGRFLHDPHVRWDYCVRAKRGQSDTSLPGCFCKDQVYLDGALQLLKRRRCLDFHLLVRMGKVAHGDIDRLMDHFQLDGTRIPSFMEDLSAYRRQLNHIAECNGLTDSVLADVE